MHTGIWHLLKIMFRHFNHASFPWSQLISTLTNKLVELSNLYTPIYQQLSWLWPFHWTASLILISTGHGETLVKLGQVCIYTNLINSTGQQAWHWFELNGTCMVKERWQAKFACNRNLAGGHDTKCAKFSVTVLRGLLHGHPLRSQCSSSRGKFSWNLWRTHKPLKLYWEIGKSLWMAYMIL